LFFFYLFFCFVFFIFQKSPGPTKERTMIGLRQVRRLRRRAPCKGSSLSGLARLASIRTWRNARWVGYADLP
jgi:hypothetical protein